MLRLVQALAAAGCALQLCVSDSGVLVLEHELELPARGRDAVTAAFLARAGVTAEVQAADDLAAPAASGSSFPDAAEHGRDALRVAVDRKSAPVAGRAGRRALGRQRRPPSHGGNSVCSKPRDVSTLPTTWSTAS